MGGFRSRREKEEIPGEGGGSAEATVFPSLRQDILHRFKSLQILEEQPGETAPTNLLLYEAALWGCMNGCKTLYLGGGVGSGEDSLFKFKKAFYRGEQLNRFFIGRKIFDENQYQFLCELRKLEEKTEYFPKYRA